MKETQLIYNFPARNFNEALPVGNGFLGAMVYGGFPTEKLTLNLDTLWTGMPNRFTRNGAYEAWKYAQEKIANGDVDKCEQSMEESFNGPFGARYMPLGTLIIEYEDKPCRNYKRRLQMSTGVAETDFTGFRSQTFVSEKPGALVVSVTSGVRENVRISFSSQLNGRSRASENGGIYIGECPDRIICGDNVFGGKGIRFAAGWTAVSDGKMTAEPSGSLVLENTSTFCLYFAAESSFINHNDISDVNYESRVQKTLSQCVNSDFDDIMQRHKAYYRKYFSAVKIDLTGKCNTADTVSRLENSQEDNGLLELLFNYGRYLTIASSAKGSQATNLQGIWNDRVRPPWACSYTVNINTEMNYWCTLMCGLFDFFEPLVSLVKKLSDTGATTAREFYHAPGFVCHHISDLWGNTIAGGGKGSSLYSFWNGSAGWLCNTIFEYYEYTLDKEWLKNVGYPLMKSAAEFYVSILLPVGDRLVITPATSPENQYITSDGNRHAAAKYTTMLQSIVQELLQNCVKCCDVLYADKEWKDELLRIIPHLKPFSIDSQGRLVEWDGELKENDVHHRHVSHLYGLFPGNLITTSSTPELADACKKSLEARGDDGTGWSLAWKACLWAKLKDADHSVRIIRRQLKLVDGSQSDTVYHNAGGTYPNLFDAHPPFQIDGNFGITTAIALLFLQYEDGMIKILPALPKEIPNGNISGLAAKGGIVTDISWICGKVVFLRLKSKVMKKVSVMVNDNVVEAELKANKWCCVPIEK